MERSLDLQNLFRQMGKVQNRERKELGPALNILQLRNAKYECCLHTLWLESGAAVTFYVSAPILSFFLFCTLRAEF